MNKYNEGIINEQELRKAVFQLKPNNQLFEVRILGKKPLSGYFRDVDRLIEAFDTVDLRQTNVYITLNNINDDLFYREQANKFLAGKSTTNDNDVFGYDWLFIDLDPERPAGISSTDEELELSASLAQDIYVYLKSIGFEEPVKAYSGNGYHLLYSIGLKNNEENKNLLERCLKALSLMFSTDKVKVDTAVANPSRICKLYGTLAQKGSNSDVRKHRMSRIDGDLKELKTTEKIYLEKLAHEIPEEEVKPAQYNRYSPNEFDIEDWMNQHGIRYKEESDATSTKYILHECPFDSNHRGKDAMIFKLPSGAIGFKCFHNSCQGKTWQDVRRLFEPDAYEKSNEAFDKAIEEGWKRHNRERKKKEINVENGSIWETISEILSKPTPDNEYIKTHINVIDKKMHGLMKGGVSVWSGLRASAKSTILSQIALQAVNDDHTVLFYSGELTDKRFSRWLIQQAAGKQYSVQYEKDGGVFWYVPDDTKKKIGSWIGNRLFVYNNSYNSVFENLINAVKDKVEANHPDLIIMDNLMTIDIMALDSNEYRAQTVVLKGLAELAKQYNVHIALVAHPRKAETFLRLKDISGTGNIANLVDSAFIVHRVNHDFIKGYLEEFCRKGTNEDDVPLFNATNVIEIAKDREEGIQDEFIPLWYEVESRRIKNETTETIRFNWTDEWMEEERKEKFMIPDELEY